MPNMNVTLPREGDEIVLDVEFDVLPAEPDVGIFSWGAEINQVKVETAPGVWTKFELGEKEWEYIATYIEENYEEDEFEPEYEWEPDDR